MDQIDLLFGKIALKNKLVTQDDLQVCADTRRGGDARSLAQILFDDGFIGQRQFKAISSYILKKTGTTLTLTPRAPAEEPPAAPAPAAEPRRSSSGRRKSSSARSRASSDRVPARARGGATNGKIPPLDALLAQARKQGASDLHFSPEAVPSLRIHGSLRPIDGLPLLTADVSLRRLEALLSDEQRAHLHERLDLDTCLAVPGAGRFRASIMKQRRGFAGVFRVINEKVPTLKELGLPKILERFTTFHQGIVLVTGAAGSGKSSTLAALIDIINGVRKDHIITLEDPIEYVFTCKKANVTQRQIEAHTQSWGNALRASLREDPDVIMVGEMRDLDTMRLAVTAAETGHLVLATLHTTNTTRTIDRLLDVFPPKEQAQIRAMVSESLRGVVSQQLVPRADGTGRAVAVELLFNTPAVANLIRERQTFKLYSILQTGKRLGMRLMDDSLQELLDQGVISLEAARQNAQNARRFAADDGDDGGFEPIDDDGPTPKKRRGWRR